METEAPQSTFYPSLREGGFSLSLDTINSNAAPLTSVSASSTITSRFTSGGVLWYILATRPQESISCMIVFSVGLLLPGKT